MASKQYSPCQNRAVGVEGYQVKCDEEMEDMEVMVSLERQSSGDNGIQDREDDQAVDEEAEDDGGEVPAQLHQHLPKVAHPQHLPADEEENSNWSKVDHPSSDHHHGVSERGEEVEERLALLAKLGKGNAKDDRKEDQAKDV